MGAATDILVVPFFGQGHLFPCAELCKRLSSHNHKSIFIIPSHLSSSISSDLHHHPSVEVIQIDHHDLGHGIQSFLSGRYQNVRPAFVVVDVLMIRLKPIFIKANIPIVSFFTSGACATAMEYAASKPQPALPGLPHGIAMTDLDIKRRDRRRKDRGERPGRLNLGPNLGPPKSGPLARWMDQTEDSAALIINTCDDLEAPFLKFLTSQVEKPVFGVGPLLPDSFWKSIGSVVRDSSRPGRDTNYTEEEVIQWLDSKPRGSVIYVSFGSEVGPSVEEYDELAEALAETEKSFIWVIQPGAGKPGPPANMFGGKDSSEEEDEEEEEAGYLPHGLEERVGNRGLIIKGWAPQLSILSHPSTGGFLSHCGWNSTVEAICCGVPILGWPIRGDQFYDANMVAEYLKVGHKVEVSDEKSIMVKKNDVMGGIKAVMDDGGVGDRAMGLRGIFEAGYPSTSAASCKALIQFLSTK
ncbi:UDP-glycosyltransferase 73B5-like [Salvia miltiorrhiza]|uniref:UDP-glycosyltransferase 73B5-like n=1 Tax=Salvia miltiorrhiza TaxID=226208 RepID=UPI0025ACD4A4|nr:UDP-glycosyltransferase 73B5-like [Salvia miltiorrhiza]